jgi:hypothetical protein
MVSVRLTITPKTYKELNGRVSSVSCTGRFTLAEDARKSSMPAVEVMIIIGPD